MNPILQIVVTLAEDGQIKLTADGPAADNKTMFVGLLEIAKWMVLSPKQGSPSLLLAKGGLPKIARTTIDQTFFNREPRRLEGTFYFPLPPDASLSRLAMYVDGNLMEGGMAERDYARTVFETIVTREQDPALLEWMDGSTFRMRVFPLEPRQEKRIVLSYTQALPILYGQTRYRFPAGHSLPAVRDWSFHARIKSGADLSWSSDSHELKATRDGADLEVDPIV